MGRHHDSKKKEEAWKEKKQERRQKGQRGGHASAHWKTLEGQLLRIGLRCKQITGDGNCFFRAISDQIHGDEKGHKTIRDAICNHMSQHAEEFKLFVEDDESWEDYLGRMRKDGTWAGQIELVVASRVFSLKLHIHQHSLPVWVITEPSSSKPVHLAFEDDHYNSVRMLNDFSDSPPAPINPTLGSSAPEEDSSSIRRGMWGEDEEKAVSQGTGCKDQALVQKFLLESNGDVDIAIERLIEHLSRQEEAQEVEVEKEKITEEVTEDKEGGPSGTKVEEAGIQLRSKEGKALSKIEKKLKKGKMSLEDVRCSCGSGKKTKNCCGRRKEVEELPPAALDLEIALKTLVL